MPNQTFSVFKSAKLVDHTLQAIVVIQKLKLKHENFKLFCVNT